MKVRLLGAHNLETRETRHTCFLVDDFLVIDAGSLVTSLGVDEIERLRTVLLTHHHFDHTRDLPTVGLLRRGVAEAISVHALPETLDGLRRHLMDGNVYPDHTQELSGAPPRYRLHTEAPLTPFSQSGYTVTPVPMPHPVPSVGYIVQSPSGEAVAFSGDTGGNLEGIFRQAQVLRALYVDVTFPDRMISIAKASGHLTPGLLNEEVRLALDQGLTVPPLVAVHRGVGFEQEIERELDGVRQELGVDIILGSEGMTL